jgi:hypothetical protein
MVLAQTVLLIPSRPVATCAALQMGTVTSARLVMEAPQHVQQMDIKLVAMCAMLQQTCAI